MSVRNREGDTVVSKEKVEKPQVWDGKKQKWVDARQAICSRCDIKGFIAMTSGKEKICFTCYEEIEKRWKQ
jgi:hypothetical protein